MFSALHHQGRRLYELAREGVEVERAPREVTVHRVDVEDVSEATATLRIACGRGTYVRTLAADLGAALGCGGAVERLVRTRVGPFEQAHAVPAAEVASEDAQSLWERVLAPEAALEGWNAVHLDPAAAGTFLHGQPAVVTSAAPPHAGFVRVHDEDGAMLGIGKWLDGGQAVQPVRILNADRPGTRVLPA